MTAAIKYEGRETETFIQSYSGRSITFLNPKEDQIDIDDIAHTLSLLCRFGGHCRTFYSVAEHSVRCAQVATPERRLEALLHDASEAYLVDMPRPIKQELQGYRDIEGTLDLVIRKKYGLPEKMTEEVKYIDDKMLATEKRDLMKISDRPWNWLPDPYDFKIEPWSYERAYEEFLAHYEMYS